MKKLAPFLPPFFLILIGLIVYSNTLKNTLFWDDDDNIVNNVYIKSFRYLPQIFLSNQIEGVGQKSNQYRPLLLLSYSLEYHVFGINPFIYHFDNMMLHIINSILIFYLVQDLIKKSTIKWKLKFWNSTGTSLKPTVLIPFFSATLFLTHPVQTEAVSYVAGRTDLLALIFMLSAIMFYLRKKSWVFIGFFYILSILSKETAIILPIILLTIEWIFQHTLLYRLKVQALLWTIAIFYSILRLTVFNFQNTLNFYTNNNIFTNNILFRILTFLSTVPTYSSLLLYPRILHAERTSPIITSLGNLPTIIGFALVIFAFWSILFFRKRQPLVSFAFAWVFITLLLSSNILIPVNAIMTEHWLYVPSIGVFILFSMLITRLCLSMSKYVSIFIFCIFFTYITLLSYRTIIRNRDWVDPLTFYTQTLQWAPESARVHNNLAMAYASKKKHAQAIVEYQKAISLQDSYPQTHHNLANSYTALGDRENAILEYKRAIHLSPLFYYSYKPLIALLRETHREEEARAYSEKFTLNWP